MHMWEKLAPDARLISIVPLTLNRARITIGNRLGVDDSW